MALIVACNLCVWYQTLIFESQHSVMQELAKNKNSTAGDSHGGSHSKSSGSYDSHGNPVANDHETTTTGTGIIILILSLCKPI
jgi:hypothetical protein